MAANAPHTAAAAENWKLPLTEADELSSRLLEESKKIWRDVTIGQPPQTANGNAGPLLERRESPRAFADVSNAAFLDLAAQLDARPRSPFTLTVAGGYVGHCAIAVLPVAAQRHAELTGAAYPSSIHVHVEAQRLQCDIPSGRFLSGGLALLGGAFQDLPQLSSVAVTVHTPEGELVGDYQVPPRTAATIDNALSLLLHGVAASIETGQERQVITITLPLACPPKLATSAAAALQLAGSASVAGSAAGSTAGISPVHVPAIEAEGAARTSVECHRPACCVHVRRQTKATTHTYTLAELVEIAAAA